MTQTLSGEYESEYEDRFVAETPFGDPRRFETYEEPLHEAESFGTVAYEQWAFETPFETGSTNEAAAERHAGPEAAALGELMAELNDHLFRESLEQLADEALEIHADRIAGEYGDHEMHDAAAGRLLGEHFAPLAAQAESLLDRFFERLEGYEAEALTDTEIERIASETGPLAAGFTPASEQFLGGLLRKAGKLVSGAVKLARSGVEGALSLAGKGLAAVGKLALGPLLKGLKALAKFLLRHVVKFALGQLPPALQPLAQRLSDRLFRALGETYEAENTDHEQSEGESIRAGADVAQLEAEFDVMAAQLLLVPDEAEIDHLVTGYGETAGDTSLHELDDARTQLARALQHLEPHESAQPVMEQFLPALLWPAAKTAITILGRKKLVSFLGGLLARLVKPMIGGEAAGLLAPAIADAGLRIFGLETESGVPDPRAVTAEALAATIEETVNRAAELPHAAFENETILESAVREAFEDAASTYFPGAHIKSELRQTSDRRGMFTRMPHGGGGKRYAKYSEPIEVTITPRVADTVHTFDGATLSDHLRDRMDEPAGKPLKTNVRIFQVLPGTTTAAIARAEGIAAKDLHPLTQHAAGALLGPGAAALGPRDAVMASAPSDSAHRLRLRQRLYYIEPPGGRRHHVGGRAHRARTEIAIHLRRGEIRVWLYLSETLCQRISAELSKAGNTAAAYRLILPLVRRVAEKIRGGRHLHRLPHSLRVVSDVPNLDHRIPQWLRVVRAQLGPKIGEWVGHGVARYLRNHAEQFQRTSAVPLDGMTLRIHLTRIPGWEMVRLAASTGRYPEALAGSAWLRGEPAFEVVALPGWAIR